MAKRGKPIEEAVDDTGIPDGDGTDAPPGSAGVEEKGNLDAAPDGGEDLEGDEPEAGDQPGEGEDEPEETDAGEPADQGPDNVDNRNAAIRALRAENKRLQREWAQREETIRRQSIADAEHRLSLIVDAVKRRTQEQQATQAPVEPPDPSKDPAAFLKWQKDTYDNDRRQFADAIEQQNQQIQWQRTQQMASQIDAQGEAEFPGFKAGVDHVVRDWYEDALAAGYDKQAAEQVARGNLLNFIQMAAQSGVPAHRALWDRATKKGYKAASPQTAPAQARIDGIRAAKQAPGTRSVQGIPGKAAPRQGKLTPGDLLSMKDKDFAALDDREWYDSLFGG